MPFSDASLNVSFISVEKNFKSSLLFKLMLYYLKNSRQEKCFKIKITDSINFFTNKKKVLYFPSIRLKYATNLGFF